MENDNIWNVHEEKVTNQLMWGIPKHANLLIAFFLYFPYHNQNHALEGFGVGHKKAS